MRRYLLVLSIAICSIKIHAQKIVQNPDYISSNLSGGTITKIEITNNETIFSFHLNKAIGSWIFIPKQTYIEDADKGGRLYITKAEGISLDKKYTMTDNDEIRFKLYFPALGKDVKKINYGESNPGGNWFIYKLDIEKDGKKFLMGRNLDALRNLAVQNQAIYEVKRNGRAILLGQPSTGNQTLLPEELPEDFFGNWYDKYGTLMLITTPDYIVSDIRVQYYQDIQKIGDNKFNIQFSGGFFEVLKLTNDTMVIRSDKLSTYKRRPIDNKVPKFMKGHWTNKDNSIKITDDYFYFEGNTTKYMFNAKKIRIDHVAASKSGDLIWFILYNEGNHHIFISHKIDGEYVLSLRGYMGAQYQKVQN